MTQIMYMILYPGLEWEDVEIYKNLETAKEALYELYLKYLRYELKKDKIYFARSFDIRITELEKTKSNSFKPNYIIYSVDDDWSLNNYNLVKTTDTEILYEKIKNIYQLIKDNYQEFDNKVFKKET